LYQTVPAQDTGPKPQVRPGQVVASFKLELTGLSQWKSKSNMRLECAVKAVQESLT